jgi:hypothetical protein
MLKTGKPRGRHTLAPSPGAAEGRARPVAVHRPRFDRTLYFWLGGFTLGTAGCLTGAYVPYHHPVAVTASALWWGLYFGCLGASLGACTGLLAERISASPSRESAGASEPPGGVASPALPIENSGTCYGVNGQSPCEAAVQACGPPIGTRQKLL